MKQQLQTHFKQQLKFWALILGILCTSLISSQQVQGQTLLAGWDFQTTTNGGTAAAAAPSTPTTFVANFGTGSLYLNGTNGSSTWITATSGNQLTSFGGSALNAGAGFSTVTSGASSLSVLSNVANGKSMVFSVNMTSYSNLVISYVTQRTASGFATQTWEYSTNGTTWNPIQAVSVPTGYTTQTLSTVTGLNNSATALVRLTVTGATTTTGNNRIDNVQFNVSTLAAPVVTSNSSTATVGSNFSYFISATNTPTSYTSSALPNGLTLNGSTGEISGIPTTAQSATTYTIDATNGVGTGSGTVDITINQGAQTISFGSLSPVTIGVSPFNLTATGGGSGNPITYTSSNPAVADVVGNVLTVYSAGNTDITANQAGNSNYLAASPVVQNLIVNPATLTPQTITFGPLGTVVYDAATITLTATGGGSGNPVTYVSSNTNVATIAGNILTLKGPGTADITASQAGNGAYYAAPDVMQTITVTPKDLTISGVVVTPKNYDGTNTATLDLTAATLNTLVGTDVVTITGTATYDNVNAGSGINMTMSLSLAGADAAKYTLNTQPTVTGDINQAPQFINFASLSPVTIGDPSFNLTATGGASGNPITFVSTNPTVADVAGNTVTIYTVGTTTITASQAGNSNYLPATDVNRTLVVNYPTLMAWDFNSLPGGVNNFGPSPNAATVLNANLTSTGLVRGAGVSVVATGAARGWGGVAWNNSTAAANITANKVITFTVKPTSGNLVSLGSLSPIGYRRSGTGATNVLFQYSTDGTNFTDITTAALPSTASGGATLPLIDLSGITALQNVNFTNEVTFRLVPYGASGSTGTFYLFDAANSTANDFGVNGIITPCTATSSTTNLNVCPVDMPYTWNAQILTTAGTYTFLSTNAAGCDSLATLVLTTNPCPTNTILNLNVWLEGYFDGSSAMAEVMTNQNYLPTPPAGDVDDITVELREYNTTTAEYDVIANGSTIARLHTDGTASAVFPASISGNYYVVITHRNHIQVYSHDPVTITSGTNSYSFASAATQAAGSNMVLLANSEYGMFSGDINQDGYVDGFDYGDFDTDSQNNVSGTYVSTDLNGDGYVDSFDYGLMDANTQNNVTVQFP